MFAENSPDRSSAWDREPSPIENMEEVANLKSAIICRPDSNVVIAYCNFPDSIDVELGDCRWTFIADVNLEYAGPEGISDGELILLGESLQKELGFQDCKLDYFRADSRTPECVTVKRDIPLMIWKDGKIIYKHPVMADFERRANGLRWRYEGDGEIAIRLGFTLNAAAPRLQDDFPTEEF